MSIYEYKVKKTDQTSVSLEEYAGKVVCIVNTASKCGLVGQLDELEELYEKYKEEDFVILGFPCNQFHNQEPLDGVAAAEFCKLNYGVTFPIFDKIDVNGENADPLYKYLVQQTDNSDIKWNFTKFLIGRDGEIIKRFAPITAPKKMEKHIQQALAQ
jgi:glutathione peroxidase